jgi:hypothetical protein
MDMTMVPPKALGAILDDVRSGRARLLVPTYTRCTVIDKKTLASWERAGIELLREEGDGYRMRTGKGSVYVLPGQLKIQRIGTEQSPERQRFAQAFWRPEGSK